MSPINIGLVLLAAGTGTILVVFLVLRLIPNRRSSFHNFNLDISISPEIHDSEDAVLLIQNGGRVIFSNETARRLFGYQTALPSLERLARRINPENAFLGLCAREGQARFSIDNRLVEANSYTIPLDEWKNVGADLFRNVIMLTIRYPQVTTIPLEGAGAASAQALDIFAELSQRMTASLDLEKTLNAILESVERLIPSDFFEITRWDEANQFLIPYRFVGTGAERHLESAQDRYVADKGYSGYLISKRQPLLVTDVDTFREVRPAVDRKQYPFFSYLGIPLQVAGNLIGTLELASLYRQNFAQKDLEVLRIMAGPAAVALNNAILFQNEQKRILEFSGLASLARAVGDLGNLEDLFERLVNGISPLIKVKTLGFLLYNENRHSLEAQSPFQGIPEQMLDLFKVTIQESSPAEKIFLEQDRLITSNAQQDPVLMELGLSQLAIAAGIQKTVLISLAISGRRMGYLQAGDKINGSPFDDSDLHLLEIISSQAAAIIENAMLVRESQERAQRSEALRRIASLVSSNATIDEILSFSLRELARLFHADLASIYLLDETLGELKVHRESLFGLKPEDHTLFRRLSITDPDFIHTATGSRLPNLLANVEVGDDLVSIYRPLQEAFHLQSLMVVPLSIRNQSIGEVMLASCNPEAFDQNSLTLAVTTASQLASALEKSVLYTQTDESLRRRVVQLLALTRISQVLNTTLELERVMRLVYDEILQTTQADCGSIVLFDNRNGSGRQIKFTVGDPNPTPLSGLELQVIETGEPHIVMDFYDQELPPPHPEVHSALLVPIAFEEEVAGLISLHARTSGLFDKTALDIVQSLAVQAAIALGNAQRYQEQIHRTELLNRRVETMTHLLETSRSIQAGQSLEESLTSIAFAIQNASPFDVVLISVYRPQDRCLVRIAGAGIPLTAFEELRNHLQPWSAIQPLLQPEFQQGNSYLIPHERASVVDPSQVHAVQVMPSIEEAEALPGTWHPDDLLFIPLFSSDGTPAGLVSVDAPRNGLRPDRPAIESLEVFASQAGLVIETSNQISSLKLKMETLQADLQRIKISAQNSQQSLPSILRKDLEQTLEIHSLVARNRNMVSSLEIIEAVNRQQNRSDVLRVLGEQIMASMEMKLVMVAELGEGGPRLLHLFGEISEGVNPQALLGQRNPIRTVLLTGNPIYVNNLEDSREWKSSPLLQSLEGNAFFCFPILTSTPGKENGSVTLVDAAVLGLSEIPLPPFATADEQVFRLLADQVGLTLQGINLVDHARQTMQELNILAEFSRQLGALDPNSILRTLVESVRQVCPATQACMVALWSPEEARLEPRYATGYIDNEKILKISYRAGESLPGRVFEENKSLRLAEINFAQQYDLSQESLLLYRDATGGQLPVSSMVVPLKTQEQRLGVMVLENFKEPSVFHEEDQSLVTSLARQAALTLANLRLYQAAEARAAQLQGLTRVAETITSSLKVEELTSSLLNQAHTIIPFDTGILWLRQGSQFIVQAASGFADNEQRIGLTVKLSESLLLQEMANTGLPLYVPDVRLDERFPSLIEPQYLSWLGMPLLSKGEVIGVLVLEKTEPNYYQAESIQAMITFTGQASVALENARLFEESFRRTQELDQRSRRLALLNRLSTELSESLDLNQILTAASTELAQAIPLGFVSMVVFDNDGRAKVGCENPQRSSTLPITLPEGAIFERLRQSLGVFSSEDITTEPELNHLMDYLASFETRSILILPLVSEGVLVGLAMVLSPQVYRFSPEETELGLTIANQVAVAIQNARLFQQVQVYTYDLEKLVDERTAQVAREHHRIQTLLSITTELSASLDLDMVLNRTLTVINETTGAEHSAIMLIQPNSSMLYLRAVQGYVGDIPKGGQDSSLKRDEGLAGWVVNNRQAVLIQDIHKDDRWLMREDVTSQHRAAMGVPLLVGEDILGAMMCYHRKPGSFQNDQLELMQATAKQIAVAINNAQLYGLIRDQAEHLGDMLRTQHIETSRSQAILEAVADGVLVTDARRQITLFNASAEQILGLRRAEVMGRSLESFSGLFGKAGQEWFDTIKSWSNDSLPYRPGNMYQAQIELDNRRVVAVHLSPVRLRNDFLGTVSIFRDITHEVEVDRLKSEFVGTVSHELRTPLTSIKGYVDILLMGAAGMLEPQQQHFLEVVKTNTERLSILVNDLLDVSRIEAGKISLLLQSLDMHSVADEVFSTISRRMEDEQRVMKLVRDIPADLPPIYGDRERVLQIMDNLMANAYQYTKPGGTITIRMRQLDGEVQVDIQDTGIGVKPEEKERVFERFYRGDDPLIYATSGNGLGLSIVKKMVEMHGGRIWLESHGVPGMGSIFSFTLPIYDPDNLPDLAE